MSTLSNAILTENLTGAAEEVLASLLETVVLSTDSTTYSLAGLADRLFALGVDTAVLIELRYHIRTLLVGGDTLEGFLLTAGGASGGVNFSLPSIRSQLQYNQSLPQTSVAQQLILAGMLQVGERTGALWTKYLGSEPTLEQIQVALAYIAEQEAIAEAAEVKAQLRVWLRQRCDEIDLQIIANQITTQEAAIAAWSE